MRRGEQKRLVAQRIDQAALREADN